MRMPMRIHFANVQVRSEILSHCAQSFYPECRLRLHPRLQGLRVLQLTCLAAPCREFVVQVLSAVRMLGANTSPNLFRIGFFLSHRAQSFYPECGRDYMGVAVGLKPATVCPADSLSGIDFWRMQSGLHCVPGSSPGGCASGRSSTGRANYPGDVVAPLHHLI